DIPAPGGASQPLHNAGVGTRRRERERGRGGAFLVSVFVPEVSPLATDRRPSGAQKTPSRRVGPAGPPPSPALEIETAAARPPARRFAGLALPSAPPHRANGTAGKIRSNSPARSRRKSSRPRSGARSGSAAVWGASLQPAATACFRRATASSAWRAAAVR